MPQFQPFDYGRAIQRGTQNALSTIQARGAGNELQRQQAIRGAFQGGATNEEAANVLRKQGYGMAANELTRMAEERRSNRISSELEGMQFIAATAPMARDDRSWQAVKKKWENLGIAAPGELPDQYDPELVQTLSGQAEERLKASDLVPVVGEDGRTRYLPADQAPGRRVPEKASGGTQTERQVMRLMERGFDRNTAEDIAFGRISVDTDDFGRTWLTNEATGERRLAGEAQTQGQPEKETAETPREAGTGGIEAAAMEGTGPMAAARQFGNRVIGPFMEGQPFPETEGARQQLRIFNQQIKQSLTANPRNPVAELNTIQGFLPNPDSIITDPDGEREKVKQLRGFLKQRRDLNQQQIDSGFIPTDVKAKFAEQNAQIDQALTLMNEFGGGASEPQGNKFTMDNPANPQTREEYEDLPSGAFFIDDEGLKRKP